MDNIYKLADSDMEEYFKQRKKTISAKTVKNVCMEWMCKFDELVHTRQVNDARKANIIRSELVSMIVAYAPLTYATMTLQDNGNIDQLRSVIKSIV